MQKLGQHAQPPVHGHHQIKRTRPERGGDGGFVERVGMHMLEVGGDGVDLVVAGVQNCHRVAPGNEAVHHERSGRPRSSDDQRGWLCHCLTPVAGVGTATYRLSTQVTVVSTPVVSTPMVSTCEQNIPTSALT